MEIHSSSSAIKPIPLGESAALSSPKLSDQQKIDFAGCLDPFVHLLSKVKRISCHVMHCVYGVLTSAQLVFFRLIFHKTILPTQDSFKKLIDNFESEFLVIKDRVGSLEKKFQQNVLFSRNLEEVMSLNGKISDSIEALKSYPEENTYENEIQNRYVQVKESYKRIQTQMDGYVKLQASSIVERFEEVLDIFTGIEIPKEISEELIQNWEKLRGFFASKITLFSLEEWDKLNQVFEALDNQISTLRRPSLETEKIDSAQPLKLKNRENSCYLNSVLQTFLCVEKICGDFKRPIDREDFSEDLYLNKSIIQQEILKFIDFRSERANGPYSQMELILFLMGRPSYKRFRKAIFASGLHPELKMDLLRAQHDSVFVMEMFINEFLHNYKFKWQPHFETTKEPAGLKGLEFIGREELMSTLQITLREQPSEQNLQSMIELDMRKRVEQAEKTFNISDQDYRVRNKDGVEISEEERAEIAKSNPSKKVPEYRLWQRFTELPPVLALHLKRFVGVDGVSKKIDSPVDLSEEIDLTPYSESLDGNLREARYKIKSYIVHQGNLNHGHFVANVEINGKYYHCDDTRPNQEITKEEFFGCKDVYLIVLERLPEDSVSTAS